MVLTPRSAIDALSDLRRQWYWVTNMIRPRNRMEDFQELDGNEQLTLSPMAAKHLMSDDDGNFPLSRLNTWEGRSGHKPDVAADASSRNPGHLRPTPHPARPAGQYD